MQPDHEEIGQCETIVDRGWEAVRVGRPEVMGSLAPGADVAGRNKLSFKEGPPEAVSDELGRSDSSGVAG